MILDGGLAPCGLPSTVVRFTGDTISIVREGAIASATVLAAWKEIAAQHTTVAARTP